jgi:hypothetical protein
MLNRLKKLAVKEEERLNQSRYPRSRCQLGKGNCKNQKKSSRRRKKKKGNANWNPNLNDKLLVQSQNTSDAVKGVIDKFMHLYAGPYTINRI